MKTQGCLAVVRQTSTWVLLPLLVQSTSMTSAARSSDVELSVQYVSDAHDGRFGASRGTWTWENPRPQGNDLYTVFVLGEDDVWVGGRGTLMHWDGKSWRFSVPPDAQWPFYVSQIWASDPQNVWAVVDQQLLQWNGSAWENAGLPNGGWQSVWGVGPDDVWAAGGLGIFHFGGVSWSRATPDSCKGYCSALLWGVATDDVSVWTDYLNRCFHWNGDSWQTMECPPAPYVGGAGPGEPWFYDSTERVFLRLHDGTWERYPSPFPGYRSVWSPAVDDAWAIGYEQETIASFLLHFDGQSWLRGPSTPHRLTRVGASASDAVWAVGDRGAILRFDGTFEEQRTGSPEHLSKIYGFSENELWAVGASGTVLRRNPTGWKRISVPTERSLLSISGTSPTDLWVVGDGSMALHFDGRQWSEVPTGERYGLSAVWASGPDDVWASDSHEIGDGPFLHWDGTAWQRMPYHPGVNGFWGFAPDDVWTVGRRCYWMPDHSLVCFKQSSHFDGASWTVRFIGEGGFGEGFGAIWGAEPNDLWAVGSQTYHWDGTDWTRVAFPELGWCAGVWGSGKDDVFAACELGVAHWDGSIWTRLRTPSGHRLSGIWGLASKVWAVGENGAILKYEPDEGR